ncbi:hypothetical protein [Streptomyces sp. NPDC101237]|uniref:hypothetical protein n=1 Tax=Streptomyces sp. NPDC101237 TaxID=3366139 RepID=UPI003813C96C
MSGAGCSRGRASVCSRTASREVEANTPPVGKTPYSSPGQGGFFGWMRVAVDPRPARVKAGGPSPRTLG